MIAVKGSAWALERGEAQMESEVPRGRDVLVAPEVGVYSLLYGAPGTFDPMSLEGPPHIRSLRDAWRERVVESSLEPPVTLRRAWSRLCMEHVPRGSHAGMTSLRIHARHLTLTYSGTAPAFLVRGGRVRRLTEPHDLLNAYLKGNGSVVSSGRTLMFSDGMLMQERFQRVEAPRAGPGGARFWSDRLVLTPEPGDLFVLATPGAVQARGEGRLSAVGLARLASDPTQSLAERARALAEAAGGDAMVERCVVLVAF